MSDRTIKFNQPFYGSGELQNISFYLKHGRNFTSDVSNHILKVTGAASVYLTAGATSAMNRWRCSWSL